MQCIDITINAENAGRWRVPAYDQNWASDELMRLSDERRSWTANVECRLVSLGKTTGAAKQIIFGFEDFFGSEFHGGESATVAAEKWNVQKKSRIAMNAIGLTAILANLVLSAGAGACAKQWANSQLFAWLAGGILLNIFGFVALAWVIRSVGLGMGTSLALLATLCVNALIGLAFFGETMGRQQALGVVLSVIAIAMMTLGTSAPKA